MFLFYKKIDMDLLRKIFAILLPALWLGAIGWYINHGNQISTLPEPYSFIVTWIIILLLLGFLIVFGLLALPISKAKLWAIIASLLVVVLGYGFLVNDVDKGIYVGDIVTVIGVVMVYLSLWGLIVSKKAQQKLKESKQIVIEV